MRCIWHSQNSNSLLLEDLIESTQSMNHCDASWRITKVCAHIYWVPYTGERTINIHWRHWNKSKIGFHILDQPQFIRKSSCNCERDNEVAKKWLRDQQIGRVNWRCCVVNVNPSPRGSRDPKLPLEPLTGPAGFWPWTLVLGKFVFFKALSFLRSLLPTELTSTFLTSTIVFLPLIPLLSTTSIMISDANVSLGSSTWQLVGIMK